MERESQRSVQWSVSVDRPVVLQLLMGDAGCVSVSVGRRLVVSVSPVTLVVSVSSVTLVVSVSSVSVDGVSAVVGVWPRGRPGACGCGPAVSFELLFGTVLVPAPREECSLSEQCVLCSSLYSYPRSRV